MGLRRDLFSQPASNIIAAAFCRIRSSLDAILADSRGINFSIHLNAHSAPQPNECGALILYYIILYIGVDSPTR